MAEQSSPAPSAAELLQRLRALYATYLEESDALFREQEVSVSETFKRYLLMDEVRNAPLHKKFYQDTERCVNELVAALECAPSLPTAQAALDLLLQEKPEGANTSQRSWLIAAEGIALALVPQLSPAAAGQLAAQYGQQYRWVEMMPRQRALYNALLKQAGQPPHKQGLLAGFLTKK